MSINKNKVRNFLLDHIIEVLLLILILGMWTASDSFMTLPNWMNILRNVSLKGVIAFGMTMVIIAGQIDLSVGSTVALSGVIVARMCRDLPEMTGMSVDVACVLGIVVALLAAVAIGVVHGILSHSFNMPAFIVTLATQNLLYGLAGTLCEGFPIANEYPSWFIYLGTGKIGGVQGFPIPGVILLLVFAAIFFLMNYTTTGRAIYAVGGNPESARLSGINVLKTKIVAFAVVQVMCVLGGFMNSAQVMAGSFSFGRGWEVDVISSVVIGGTSMLGGVGKVWGTLIGIIFLGVILNGMTILDISVYAQYIIRGILMAFAVLIATYQAKSKA